MSALRIFLFSLLAGAVLFVAYRGTWEGHLVQGNLTSIIDLPSQPVWSPPKVPTYEAFRQTFTRLPPEQPTDAVLHRVFRFDLALFELILLGAASCAICGVLYTLVRKGRWDVFLHWAFWITIGIIAATIVCFVLWILLGGWGPPFPLLFSILGVGLGIALGCWRQPANKQ